MFIEINRGHSHICKGINSWQTVLLVLFSFTVFVYADVAGCQPITNDSVIGLKNKFIQVEFDLNTGQMTSLRNLICEDDYLKGNIQNGNPFCIFPNTDWLPDMVLNPSSPYLTPKFNYPTNPGIDPSQCTLQKSEFKKVADGYKLILNSTDEKNRFEFVLEVFMPEDDFFIDMGFTVVNKRNHTQSVLTAFPHFSGVCLGDNPETNLGIRTYSFGIPDEPAWVDSGGVYGRQVNMQWQAVYDKENEGVFSFVINDYDFKSKIIRRAPKGVMSTLYFPKETIDPNEKITLPSTRLFVYKGSWRTAAKRYGQCVQRSTNVRPLPTWIDEIDTYGGGWFPSREEVEEGKKNITEKKTCMKSFRDFELLYEDTFADIAEWAQYNNGVLINPETYGPYMSDGFYLPRDDLGGIKAIKDGIERVHQMGRRVILYIAGYGITLKSPLFDDSDYKDWMMMANQGEYKLENSGYPGGFFACVGNEKWQDNLAAAAKRLVSLGVDGIRLDELGKPVYRCLNPKHNHENPYDEVVWIRQLLQKVRVAMDEINPDALLTTEYAHDYMLEYTNGALNMFYSGRELQPMRIAFPAYVGMGGTAMETIMSNMIGQYPCAFRSNAPYAKEAPYGFPDCPEFKINPTLYWHNLRQTFIEASLLSSPTLKDPFAPQDQNWLGRIWQAPSYLLMGAGYYDLPDQMDKTYVVLPEEIEYPDLAIEINLQDLTYRTLKVQKNKDRSSLELEYPFSAVLLPKPDCQPLLMGHVPSTVKQGESLEIQIDVVAPWLERKKDISAKYVIPGIVSEPVVCRLPSKWIIQISPDQKVGYYFIKVEGDCLNFKRWFLVQENIRKINQVEPAMQ